MANKPARHDSEGEKETEVPAAGPPRRGKKLLVIGAGILVIIGAGAGGAYLKWGPHIAQSQAALPPKPVAFFDMPDVLVNLTTGGGERTQYLRLKIVLELPEASVLPQVQPVLPRVMDAFQVYLRELRPIDLDGSAGIYRLKEELTRRVNLAIAPTRINAVLFKEMLVQ